MIFWERTKAKMKHKKGSDGKFIKKDFWDFKTSRMYVHSCKFKSYNELQEAFLNDLIPHQVPRRPDRQYQHSGWISYTDFLGIPKKIEHMSYADAEKLVREQSFKSTREYLKFKRMHPNLPTKPQYVYQDKGWDGWKTFFKTPDPELEYKKPRKLEAKLKSLEEAKAFVKPFKIQNQSDWYKHVRLGLIPNDIPTYPSLFYNHQGWDSWEDFLSKNKP
jgi:hypothetical protein